LQQLCKLFLSGAHQIGELFLCCLIYFQAPEWLPLYSKNLRNLCCIGATMLYRGVAKARWKSIEIFYKEEATMELTNLF